MDKNQEADLIIDKLRRTDQERMDERVAIAVKQLIENINAMPTDGWFRAKTIEYPDIE
jgi:hypothetical protein